MHIIKTINYNDSYPPKKGELFTVRRIVNTIEADYILIPGKVYKVMDNPYYSIWTPHIIFSGESMREGKVSWLRLSQAIITRDK